MGSFLAKVTATRSRRSPAGRALGVEIIIVESHSERDFDTAAATMVEGGADAMVVAAYPFRNSDKVVSLTALYKLPTIYPFPFAARMAVGRTHAPDLPPLYRRLGSFYAAQILKGDKPADLPVEQATKFKLAINLKTAKAIDVDVPPQLLAIADEVIE